MAKKSKAKSTRRKLLNSAKAITSLAEFVRIVVRYFPNNRWVFRGQGKLHEPLRPKAGRKQYFIQGKDKDLERFKRWCHQAVAFSRDLPVEPFEKLAYAQHYGLATRLLDWTLNAAAALYFATELGETRRSVGGVFFYRRPPEEIDQNDCIGNCKDVKLYQPRPITQRIIAQDSIFTFHPDPKKAMLCMPFKLKKGKAGKLEPDGNLLAMCVPARLKRQIQRELRTIGVLRRSLFPDIEGLSASVNCASSLYNDFS
jgi:hypothetical protein